jgi:hypothetical protein
MPQGLPHDRQYCNTILHSSSAACHCALLCNTLIMFDILLNSTLSLHALFMSPTGLHLWSPAAAAAGGSCLRLVTTVTRPPNGRFVCCEVPCSCSPISQSHFSSSQSTFLPQHASGMLHPIRVSEASDVFSYVTGLLCNQHNSAAHAH